MEAMLKALKAIQGTSLDFKPMTKTDWDGFAGADEGSLIAGNDDATFILSPKGTLSVIWSDEAGDHQIDLTPNEIQ